MRVCAAESVGATTTTTTPAVAGVTPVESGTSLYCYECYEKYSSSFDAGAAPCLNNLTQVTVRQCSPADRYCKVCRRRLLQRLFPIAVSAVVVPTRWGRGGTGPPVRG